MNEIDTDVDFTPEGDNEDIETTDTNELTVDREDDSSVIKQLRKQLRDADKRLKAVSTKDVAPEKTQTKAKPLSDKASLEDRLFFIENPQAAEHKDKVREVLAEFKGVISHEQALKIVLANEPATSRTKRDLDLRSRVNITPPSDDEDEDAQWGKFKEQGKPLNHKEVLKAAREQGIIKTGNSRTKL